MLEDLQTFVNKHLGLKQEIISINEKDIKKGFEFLVSNLDQPMADPASISYVITLQDKFKDIDTFIDGTGNDYYFGLRKPGLKLLIQKKKVENYVPNFCGHRLCFYQFILVKKSSMIKKNGPGQLKKLSLVGMVGMSRN